MGNILKLDKYQTTAGLVKQKSQEFDYTVRDADEEIIPNHFRGLSKNYIKLITLVDYPSSIECMIVIVKKRIFPNRKSPRNN